MTELLLPDSFSTRRQLLRVGADPRAEQRRVASGEHVRIRAGVYLNRDEWAHAGEDRRYLAKVHAVALTRKSEPVFSHESAALLWGLPTLHTWPSAVHVLAGRRRAVRTGNGIIWHFGDVPDEDVVPLGGLLVTSLERTLVDLARTRSMQWSVAAIDHALRTSFQTLDGATVAGVHKEALLDRLDRLGSARGTRQARESIEFGDGLSGSPGESLSRVQIHMIGFPPPILQLPVSWGDGFFDYPDFAWDDLFGEFDGLGKYLRDEFTRGRPIEEIVLKEKEREDRLRSTGRGVSRWGWKVAGNACLLEAKLRKAGLRPIRRPRPQK